MSTSVEPTAPPANASSPVPAKTLQKPGRLDSLDVFRGMTIAGMILVNNSGGQAYPPLRHAEWDGLTPTDLVFPFFVFIVGVAIPFSFGNRKADGSGTFGLLFRIVRRAILIFGIGILLHAFPNFNNWDTIRIPGVLQRIAVCYLFASLLALMFGPRALAAITAILLAGYAAAMRYIPVPDGPTGDLSREGNLAAWVDRALLSGHLYKKDYDPEGLLSTIPAIGSALIGVLGGILLRSNRSAHEKVANLMVGGACSALLGYFWSAGMPVNKALWTPPFVLMTAGFAMLLLGTLYWVVDLKGWKGWAWPFRVYGRNAIAAYVLAGLLSRLIGMAEWDREGKSTNLRSYLAGDVFRRFLEPMDASLLWAVSFNLVCFLAVWVMYRFKIFIKL